MFAQSEGVSETIWSLDNRDNRSILLSVGYENQRLIRSCLWWLRAGEMSGSFRVTEYGQIGRYTPHSNYVNVGIRPAIIIKKDKRKNRDKTSRFYFF